MSEVGRMNLTSLMVSTQFVVEAAHLEADGIHLTPAAGDLFLASIGNFLRSESSSSPDVTLVDELIDVDESSDDGDGASSIAETEEDKLGAILKIVKSNSKRLSSVKPLKAALDQLTANTSAFEAQVRLRRQRDNLIFARIKEEADSELNRSKEDRVVISGLDRSSLAPTSHLEKKEHYKQVVTALVASALPVPEPAPLVVEPRPVVVDVTVSLQRDQAKPSVEARFDTVEGAAKFRKAAAALAKDKNPDFVQLFFSNSITHATRVRIEIMKAVAKKLTTETEKAFVQGFISRPVMRYLSRNPEEVLAAGAGRSYSFVDTVSRFGDLVQSHDLTSAYRRAGSTFRGALEQYFVLLNDDDFGGANHEPLGPRAGPSGYRGSGYRGSGHRGRAGSLVRGSRGRKRFGSPPATPQSKKPSA